MDLQAYSLEIHMNVIPLQNINYKNDASNTYLYKTIKIKPTSTYLNLIFVLIKYKITKMWKGNILY